jgi:hypothetical protein
MGPTIQAIDVNLYGWTATRSGDAALGMYGHLLYHDLHHASFQGASE